ncbi:MAG: class I SAM-dependent methyltransferase [Promethearchaeota archaeon]|jgi:methyltransferase (TIGR00027 family)
MPDQIRSSGTEYPMVCSDYIEESLLKSWCILHNKSQIVLLGAGLDTRAYRYKSLKTNVHRVFEIDFPYVISHKEEIMKDKQSLCNVVRISADLAKPGWSSYLLENGFRVDIPTFWILEGLVYYMKREEIRSLFSKAARISSDESQIIMDIIQGSRLFQFSYNYYESMKPIDSFFESTGWKVSCKLVDDSHQNVRQKGKFFIHGERVKIH